MTGITWTSWTTTTAYGEGTAAVNDCQPTCAAGTVSRYPASIYVFGTQPGPNPVFNDITVTPTGSTGKVESSYTPGDWGVPPA
jgi:hypothetical protein